MDGKLREVDNRSSAAIDDVLDSLVENIGISKDQGDAEI